MPSPLPIWKKSDAWKRASQGGGSQGSDVVCPATGEFGHFKPRSVFQEVLASALAKEVNVPVPAVTLGICEDTTGAVSRAWGPKSMDARELKVISPQAYGSDAFKSATKAASGLLPFHAWTGTGDHKDDHLVIRPGPNPDSYEVGGVDFADAFSFDHTGGTINTPSGNVLAGSPDYRDPEVIRATIARIVALPDERIRTLVAELPDGLLTSGDRDRITQGLIARKTQIEQACRNAGWLPG